MTKNVTIPDTDVISLIDIPSILIEQNHNQGKYGGREFVYALCDGNRAIIDGENNIVKNTDDYTDVSSRLVNNLERFNPKDVVSQDEALNEDLEALGYL